MDALLMSGGQGTRLAAPVEKPLFEVGERPMIDLVLTALRGSDVDEIHGVVSPHVPETRTHLAERSIHRIRGSGEGYVADVNRALERVDTPVLTVAADLPLLEADAVDAVLSRHDRGALTTYVPAALKRQLEVSVDLTVERDGTEAAPAGVNIVADGGPTTHHVSYDVRYAVNVNRRADARVAEALL